MTPLERGEWITRHPFIGSGLVGGVVALPFTLMTALQFDFVAAAAFTVGISLMTATYCWIRRGTMFGPPVAAPLVAEPRYREHGAKSATRPVVQMLVAACGMSLLLIGIVLLDAPWRLVFLIGFAIASFVVARRLTPT